MTLRRVDHICGAEAPRGVFIELTSPRSGCPICFLRQRLIKTVGYTHALEMWATRLKK